MQQFFLGENEYNLTDAQAEEVDAKDREFPATEEGNIQFNAWFRDFLKEHSIHPINRRMSRYWTSSRNSKDDSVKMAITLRAMRSVVAVMDPEHKLQVEYSRAAETSAWDNNTIVILPTKPVRESEDLHSAIDLMSGYAVHEACHSKHTRKTISKDELKTLIDEAKSNMHFANLIEDERIEAVEMQHNPGFRSYLNKVMEHHWEGERLKSELPDSWEDCDAKQKLWTSLAAVRYPDRTKALLHSSYHPIVDSLRSISEEYTSLLEKARFSDVKNTIAKMKAALNFTEEDEAKLNEPDDGRKGPIESPCEAAHKDKGVTGKEADDIYELVEQEVERLDPKASMWLPDEIVMPKITVYRPRVISPSKMPTVDNLMQKAKAALTLRKAAPKADDRMMLSGELDEDELARLSMGDMRVFKDITEEVLPNAAVYLLVDCSGSMKMMSPGGANRIEVAQKMAFLLLSAMRHRPNVKCKVLAHTGDNESDDYSDPEGSASFYRIWEDGDDINRLSIIRTMVHGENYDSLAVAWAGNMLSQEDAEQKLLIVLSDGEPAGRNYGGDSAMRHVRMHVDKLERKGINVLSISIVGDLSVYQQQKMYKHYIGAPVGAKGLAFYDALLRNLQRVLEKVGSR